MMPIGPGYLCNRIPNYVTLLPSTRNQTVIGTALHSRGDICDTESIGIDMEIQYSVFGPFDFKN